MVDVRLLYPREKLEAAARLAGAIEAAGYAVERQALPDTGAFAGLLEKAGEGGVLLLIWSRGLVTAAMSGGLAEARRRPNLIEVSVDGIEPAFGGDNSPVVLLSGWRGQPFHLGWQRILADIKRLSGDRAVPRSSRTTDPAGSGNPAGASGRSAGRRSGVRAAVAAGALLAATLGAATVVDWGGPDPASETGARPPTISVGSPPAASAPPPAAETIPPPIPAVAAASASAPLPTAAASPSRAGAEAVPEGAASGRRPSAAEPRAKVAPQRPGANRVALVARPQVKRYSRKYSKTMRLFCQRSGRSTPQCRTFARSVRGR